jgi:hypothetical protein
VKGYAVSYSGLHVWRRSNTAGSVMLTQNRAAVTRSAAHGSAMVTTVTSPAMSTSRSRLWFG